MKTNYFDRKAAFIEAKKRQSEAMLKIENIRASSYLSSVDGVIVTRVRCRKCASMFSEVLCEAERKVLSGVALLCLDCDPDAGLSSGVEAVVFVCVVRL